MSAPGQAAILDVLRDVAAGYAALRRDDPDAWPELRLVAVKASPTCGIAPADAFVAPGEGQSWVRHQSAAWRSDEGVEPAVQSAAGRLLAAEWVSADGTASVHVRQDPEQPGKLARWDYAERDLGPNEAASDGETPALRQRLSVLARSQEEVSLMPGTNQPVLVYHVFWGADASDPHAIRRLFARFRGFGHERIVVPARLTDRTQGDRT